MYDEILCVILGGGRGTRLYPLTRDRAKPAVPLFGKYRLIDIPVSNCINSGFNKINILTQFNSESLNKHINRTYKFDQFTRGYVDIVAADQTMDQTDWFQGPADAVRKSLKHFNNPKIKYICVLSGDQLYKMDLSKFFEFHVERGAQISVACNLVTCEEVSRFGIVGVGKEGRLVKFIEKPAPNVLAKDMAVRRDGGERFLCSMGIYFFNKDALSAVLAESNKADFGKEIIPLALEHYRTYAYEFDGYWRDIGTISSFYAESLRLTEPHPPLDLFDESWPIFTRSRALPPAKCIDAAIEKSIVADGSLIDQAAIKRSIIGVRSRVGKGAQIEESIVMGADYYEPTGEIGIGSEAVVRRAILDKNARIGSRVRITNEKGLKEFDGPGYCIRDGIVIVFKNARIPDGTVI